MVKSKVIYHGNLFGDYTFVFDDCECVGFTGPRAPYYTTTVEDFIKDLEDGKYGGFEHDPIERYLRTITFR
jgi:hypothetical protein